MPPPVGPYDRANPPGSMGLTQSHDAARQQANRARGYEPDALQRTLDWIGRQLGSDKAARRPGPSAGSRVVDWIGRQFESDPWAIGGSKNPRVTDPYDRKNPAVDHWFRSLENSPTPFGNVQYGPKKPVTKISSAPKIQQKISPLLSNSPPRMPDWFNPQPGEDNATAPQWPPPYPPQNATYPDPDEAAGSPSPRYPIDMRSNPPLNTMPGEDRPRAPQWPPPVPGQPVPSLVDRYLEQRNALAGWNPFGNIGIPGIIKDYMPQLRAEGGPVGLMRGGYPELYGSQGVPMRQMFDSGGENFVGSDYSAGSGRADDVNAKLSAKEYVIDAETMALLGDGNPDHGAQKMDQMRANIRKQKGAALAKGKFTPKAKSAQEYLVGNPAGDGMRRKSRGKG